MENIKRIVAIIVERVLEGGPAADEERIRKDLVKYGFNLQDIDAAICWMSMPASRDVNSGSKAMRILTPTEQAYFDQDALDEIMSLYYEGMLNLEFLEEILMLVQSSERETMSRTDLHELITEINTRDDVSDTVSRRFITIH